MSPDSLHRLTIDKSRQTPASPRKGKRMRAIVILVLLLVAVAIVVFFSRGRKISIETTTVSQVYPSQSFTLLNASGYVVAQRKAAVASKITGRLEWLGVEEGSRVSLFRNSLAETLTETEKAFQLSFVSMTEAIVVAIRIVSYVLIIIIMAVVANTMAMTARERIGEYAIFKAIGFRNYHIAEMIVGESLFISMTGCLVGILLTFPVANKFAEEMGQFFPIFIIEHSTLYLDIVFCTLVGVIAALFPTWRAARIRIAEGLRKIG